MTTGINTNYNPYASSFCTNGTNDYFGLNSYSGTDALFGTQNYGYTTGMYYGMNSQQLEYSYDMNNQAQSYGVKTNAEQLTVTDQCNTIAQVVSEGKEDEILSEFNELVDTLKSQPQYEKCSDKEIKAAAKQIFQNTTGKSLTKAIEDNCSSSFTTGLKKGFFMGNADSTSKEDLLAEVNGTEKHGCIAAKVFGGFIGAIGGAICLGIPGLIGEHS